MNTRLIIGLIFAISPYFHNAQDTSKSHEKIRDIIAIIEEFEELFEGSRSRDRQVIVYSAPNFRGRHLELDGDWSAKSHRDTWNDEIGSIEIPRGMNIRLYEDANFRGRSLVVSGDWSVRDNPWWRNRISSLRLINSCDENRPCVCPEICHRHCQQDRPWEPGVTLYAKKDFAGPSLTIYHDWSVRNRDDFWNDRISSIHIPEGYVVVLYKHADFRGRSATLKGPWPRRRHRDFWDDWNNEISSIEVIPRH